MHKQSYNLKQIERLLKEEGTNSTLNGAVLISDWAPTGRADDKANTEIRYKIEQVTAQDAKCVSGFQNKCVVMV